MSYIGIIWGGGKDTADGHSVTGVWSVLLEPNPAEFLVVGEIRRQDQRWKQKGKRVVEYVENQ